MDELLVELRSLKLIVEGVRLGACAFTDYLLCMAPSRSALHEMVTMCERYSDKHNMVFSTDPVPAKSKPKCMLVCGKDRVGTYPAHVQLGGRDLSWVETALHLGPTLHQIGKMNADTKIRQAIFIVRSVEVREQLHYADPAKVLQAQAVYCCRGYGAMLWPLAAGSAQQYFCAGAGPPGAPEHLHHLTEGFLAGDKNSLRNQVLLCASWPGLWWQMGDL